MKEPEKRISEKALKVWRISGVISTAILWLFIAGAGVLIYMQEWPLWIIAVLAAAGILEIIIFVVALPNMRWKRWKYEVREQEIELQRGVFVIRRTLIPMIRVQHVDTEQGPLLRKYGLSVIKVSTAATVHEIPAVEMEEAEEMRRVISALARVAEEDV
ncbi:PH domain-containing protein [Bacillus aerolatus]|uniref:PH domain-containing protein n=1 Tax=Bacillus aerolatus TaxID=2653354 RepID=A0A6I1FC31_9BACI|nr:PH domain-containing protein [Bacillus aerolatus]KAB7704800.1 PH domain-containing protein [Bacillus aerolatus]